MDDWLARDFVSRSELDADNACHHPGLDCPFVVVKPVGLCAFLTREAIMNDAPIQYDIPAALYKWPSLEARRISTGDTIRAHRIFEGTLGGCIREFLAKPISQRPLYEIFTERQAGLRDSVLASNYILEISERADFPN